MLGDEAERTAGGGFPVLYYGVPSSSVVPAVQGVVGPTLLYTFYGREKNEATSAEVENWLKKLKRKEEKRVLVTDDEISRGWEAPAVMVIGSCDLENLVMRTCGFCLLINIE